MSHFLFEDSFWSFLWSEENLINWAQIIEDDDHDINHLGVLLFECDEDICIERVLARVEFLNTGTSLRYYLRVIWS